MSHRLREFLAIADLDELLAASRRLDDLSQGEQEVVRSVLRSWDNPQAVPNLLFHPTLIPEDIRVDAILRGLTERVEPWCVMAAVVGLQRIAAEDVPEEESSLILEHLIHIMAKYKGVLSSRASVSVSSFLRAGDAKRVLRFLSHPNEATRHNIMAWLLRTSDRKGVEWLTKTVNSTEVPQEVRDYALGKLRQHVKERQSGEGSTLTWEVYSFIPNLEREVSRPEAKGETFSEDSPILETTGLPD
jgi:hypothetical protein